MSIFTYHYTTAPPPLDVDNDGAGGLGLPTASDEPGLLYHRLATLDHEHCLDWAVVVARFIVIRPKRY